MTFLFCFCNHNCALPVLIEAYFLLILFGIYDDLTKDHVPGLQKYDICMTEQVSGSRRVKIEGRHLAMSLRSPWNPHLFTEHFLPMAEPVCSAFLVVKVIVLGLTRYAVDG